MTHQALARKWRPRDFGSLVGQEHVVRALAHALDSGRLHHAYLFTGTRGVGKTTIARILAKALNCETGVGSRPCGTCSACTGIDAGRFVDCIELDAASNRGVEDMTQLLENAVYAPTVGRYKVYVIDEVHMLSNHAFNAMLKTLEEPPPHVVFVLATTDPQKVPVTVLSRCLQFSLKNMPPATVAAHLQRVLQAEGIDGEPGALAQIGRAAAGSMRDALSLLDQAIAFSGGVLTEAAVREMLGVVDRAWLERILDALAMRDGAALVGQADAMLEANAPFETALSELAVLLQRVALVQAGVAVPGDEAPLLERLAEKLPPEEVQVHYQIAIHAQRDLPLAPDPHTGFTMTLLRMLAFRPDDAAGGPAEAGGRAARPGAPAPGPAAAPAIAASPRPQATPRSAALKAPPPARAEFAARPAASPADRAAGAPPGERAGDVSGRAAQPRAAVADSAAAFDGDWPALVAQVRAGGMAAQFLQQSALVAHEGLHFRLKVPIRPLAEPATVNRAREALAAHFGAEVRLSVEVGAVQGPTAAAVASRLRAEKQAEAEAAIDADPFVQTLLKDFGGTIVPGSVRPAAGNPTPGE
ncbi:DNA polymerase III subunit gamma/tau [Burkholderiaceae bacterium FT117]|uniref:DNA polymerase III subunit gamma/tau n=1 Tax=Zeimonas sediminis TaxID=2944268 RepID=UPI00234319B9|nr:DNA polymerase III subunit gamma/tau [Zeimonas sediminis]MCM5569799.1 DNA polymerase III subunit gamma/tau [Zeimonas sediminis]